MRDLERSGTSFLTLLYASAILLNLTRRYQALFPVSKRVFNLHKVIIKTDAVVTIYLPK